MLLPRICQTSIGAAASCHRSKWVRALSTLPNNPHIHYYPDPASPGQNLLSLVPSENTSIPIGRSKAIPPESNPQSFEPNPQFLGILQSVLRQYAIYDPVVQASAAAYASQAGATLSGGMFLPANHPSRQHQRRRQSGAASTSGAGPTASQGGAGGGGSHGWVHVYDLRHPPDFGRIPDPEDIFGSVEVDAEGVFVGEGGGYQESGTYRLVTRDGILGLSDFLREKLVERLKELDKAR